MGSVLQTPGATATLPATPSGPTPVVTGAQGAESQLCGDPEGLAFAVMEFSAPDAPSSVDGLRAAKDGVVSALRHVILSGPEGYPEHGNALEAALARLMAVADGMTDDDTVGAAYASLPPGIGMLELAREGLRRNTGCPP